MVEDKEILRQQRKKESNARWLEKNKDYYIKYHEKNKDERKKPYICDICELSVAGYNKSRHFKSRLHVKLIKSKEHSSSQNDLKI